MKRVLDTNLATLLYDAKKAARAPTATATVKAIVADEGLTIAAVTLYELRRGAVQLRLRMSGRTKVSRMERTLRTALVIGLDEPAFSGWDVAARMWAVSQEMKPARNFSEGDLFIAATAIFHDHVLVTSEARLAELLTQLGYAHAVEVVRFA